MKDKFKKITSRLFAFIFFICSTSIIFGTEGASRWKIDDDGHLVPWADSTYNIGNTSIRVANAYVDNYYGDGSNLTGLATAADITI